MNTTETHEIDTVTLGQAGPRVARLALGCMGFGGMYGPVDEAEGVATIQEALDAGINLVDTGDFYGMGQSEAIVGRALKGRRDKAVLSVKFGAMRGPDGQWLGYDARPVAIKNFLAYSLKRLGVEAVDIYRPARLDPAVPLEDVMGTLKDLVAAGYIKHIGLSELGAARVAEAAAIHPVTDLQIEYSLASRRPEETLFPTLRRLGVSATLYGVLSRGLLSGSQPAAHGDFRAHLPRFSGDAGRHNREVVARFSALAAQHGLRPVDLALGWVLARQPGFVALVGVKNRTQLAGLRDAVAAPLAPALCDAVERVVAFEGDRYAAEQMRHLDSER
ncbi:MAG: aldo/keto reductase [Myxococcales bacterium]|nr:aldo/keto reductase [Myxococcales bacterium]